MDEGLKKEERLHKRFQFERVYREGSAFWGRSIKLAILANGLYINRVGFAVTKKRIKLSTHRNRIKRLLREAYRHNKYRIEQGFDIILIARKVGPNLKLQEIEREMFRLAEKAGILK
jgi:ribonuclease P protein component